MKVNSLFLYLSPNTTNEQIYISFPHWGNYTQTGIVYIASLLYMYCYRINCSILQWEKHVCSIVVYLLHVCSKININYQTNVRNILWHYKCDLLCIMSILQRTHCLFFIFRDPGSLICQNGVIFKEDPLASSSLTPNRANRDSRRYCWYHREQMWPSERRDVNQLSLPVIENRFLKMLISPSHHAIEALHDLLSLLLGLQCIFWSKTSNEYFIGKTSYYRTHH